MPKNENWIPPNSGRTWCPNCGKYTLVKGFIDYFRCEHCGYEEKAMELDCRACPINKFCTVEFHTEYGKHPKDCPLIKRSGFPIVQIRNAGMQPEPEKVSLT
jgi:ribosomal protein S27AE